MSARSSVFRSSIIRYLVASYSRPDALLGPLLRLVPLNATTKQVLSLTRVEQRHYFESLYRFNKAGAAAAAAPAAAAPAAPDALYAISRTAGLIRRFNQLPCTVESRAARAALLGGQDLASRRILVLGDDDLLSVELAQRGYANVTVADCDERLLARIRQETAGCPTPPRVIQADFRQGFACPEPQDVVFLDPPYSIDGAQAFLRLAAAATAGRPGARMFLMINPGIFGSSFGDITGTAVRAGFRQVRHLPAFNGYPIGWLESTALKSAWRLVLNLPAVKRRGGLLFCSDCFEFERS